MPTTSNFGWTTPADTDYVKDGALAIRTLGNGIDTSLVDLKGGTTGQILSKASNTDLDYTWINNDQGDITAVNAGTGISVTNPTGPTPTVAIDSTVATLTGSQTLTSKTIALGSNTVSGSLAQFNTALTDGDFATLAGSETLTNKTLTSPVISSISNTGTITVPTTTGTLALTSQVINNTLTTTTGDIIYASAANTPARLGIGSTNQVLSVVGGIPAWTSPSGQTFVGARAYPTAGTSLSNGTYTAINWAAENYDTDGFHSTSTNTSRMTIPSGKGGKYLITAAWVQDSASTAGNQRIIQIRKNGTAVRQNDQPFKGYGAQVISAVVEVVATDYLEIFAYQDSGTTFSTQADEKANYFELTFIGA